MQDACWRIEVAPSTVPDVAAPHWQPGPSPSRSNRTTVCEQTASATAEHRSDRTARHLSNLAPSFSRYPRPTNNGRKRGALARGVPSRNPAYAPTTLGQMSSRQPDPDDEDTGPLHVDRLRAPSAGAAEPRFDAPLSVNPRPVHRDRRPVVLTAAATAAVVGLGVLAWAFWPSSDAGQGSASDDTTAASETEAAEQAQSRLLGLVPRGYPAGACEAVVPAKGALAQVSCSKNDDPGGPLTATYTLAKDAQSLSELFDDHLSLSSVVNCPGNIQ